MKKCPSCDAIMRESITQPRSLSCSTSPLTALPRSQPPGFDMSVANVVTRKNCLPNPLRSVDEP